jgi:hypothetical protein
MEKVNAVDVGDQNVSTRLLEKNYSPLVVRKYQLQGWPMFVGIICDQSLSDLDETVMKTVDLAKSQDMFKQDIQAVRNFVGFLSDSVISHYDSVKRGCVEGVGILWYVDKCAVSSLWGDMMTHNSCRQEFYFIINTLPHI